MNIRKIHSQDEEDIKKFITLRQQSIRDDEKYHFLMTYIDEEENFSIAGYKKCDFLKNYYIIEENDIFIAYAACTPTWPRNFQGNHNFTIWPIYVSPLFRGQNLGKKLLDAIEDDILQHVLYAHINLILLVHAENFSAIRLYRKCGFEEMGYYKNYIQTREWEYFDVKIFQKMLVSKV